MHITHWLGIGFAGKPSDSIHLILGWSIKDLVLKWDPRWEGGGRCVITADSLCFTAETNTALESNYTLIFLQLLWPPLPHHPPAPTATNNLKFWKIPIRALMKNNFT